MIGVFALFENSAIFCSREFSKILKSSCLRSVKIL